MSPLYEESIAVPRENNKSPQKSFIPPNVVELSAGSLPADIAALNLSPYEKMKSQTAELASAVRAYYEDRPSGRFTLLYKHMERMTVCGTELAFARLHKPDEYNRRYRLHSANFCKCRTCPACAWRRAQALRARTRRALQWLEESGEYTGFRWLFLTVSLKSIPLQQLDGGIGSLLNGIRNLFKRGPLAEYTAGYLKNIEITYNERTGLYHPHAHILICVRPDYFTTGYLPHRRLLALWRQKAGVGYTPALYVEALPEGALHVVCDYATKGGVMGVFGYMTKGAGIGAGNIAELEQYVIKLHHRRLFGSAGICREALAAIKTPADDDIVEMRLDDYTIFKDADFNVESIISHMWESSKMRYIPVSRQICDPNSLPERPETVRITYGEWKVLHEELSAHNDQVAHDKLAKAFAGGMGQCRPAVRSYRMNEGILLTMDVRMKRLFDGPCRGTPAERRSLESPPFSNSLGEATPPR